MTSERWRRVKEIAVDILDQQPPDWGALVAVSCADDSEIRDEVIKIVAAEQSSKDTFLSSPPWRLSASAALTGPHSTLEAGQVLAGRYEIVSHLGHGGMGEVYQARDLELQEDLALKTIRPEIARSEQIIERFKHEVKNTRRITHTNVCRVHELF